MLRESLIECSCSPREGAVGRGALPRDIALPGGMAIVPTIPDGRLRAPGKGLRLPRLKPLLSIPRTTHALVIVPVVVLVLVSGRIRRIGPIGHTPVIARSEATKQPE